MPTVKGRVGNMKGLCGMWKAYWQTKRKIRQLIFRH
nr:MAG TPA: hypothetical protein [Caudoviricetes sp.]